MKPIVIENSIGLDRLATWNEIQYAMAFTADGDFELRCASDGYCEMESDFYGWVRIPNEDLECRQSLGEILVLRGN